MAETLVIHCHDLAGTRVSWLVKGGLQILTGTGTLEEAAKLARGRRVLALIPAEEALVTQVSIPTKNRQRLIQAIPYALETELTQDVEELHFAVGATAGQDTPVVVISRIRLEKWLSALESQGIEPLGLYLDLLCLPGDEDSWSLLVDQDQAQILTGANQGFCADRENASGLLNIALQQAGDEAPRRLTLYHFEEQSLELPQEIDTESTELESQESLISLLANQLNEKSQINLLQGEYKKVDKFALQWKRWLPAAALAIVALILSLSLNLLDYYSYKRQSVAQKGEIEQLFRQAFPNVKRVVDPKSQMEQELKAMRGGQRGGSAQFGSLFVPAAALIKSSPDTRLENISFRDGQLDLQLTIKELQALERLKKAIEEKGLRVEIRTANATGNQVSSHLRITGKGS